MLDGGFADIVLLCGWQGGASFEHGIANKDSDRLFLFMRLINSLF
jgi:hypothetical protein